MTGRHASIALALLCAVLAAFAAGARWSLSQQAAQTQNLLQRLSAPADRARSANSSAAPFAERLPTSLVEPHGVLAQLQAAAQPLNVAVTAFASSSKPATDSTLGTTDLSLTLRGPYAGIKQVLNEVLDRNPSAVLQHLTIHKAQSPSDLEAQVAIRLLSRPVP